MSRVTKLQREKALEEYSNLKPISQKHLDWCVKESAKNIYVDHERNGWCTSCETKVVLPKTKHKGKVICPNCKKEMQVAHVWRFADASRIEKETDWYCFPEVQNQNILILRYVIVDRFYHNEPEVEEKARMIIDFAKDKVYTLESYKQWGKDEFPKWQYSTWCFFRESGLGYTWRRNCCLAADLYPKYLKRFNKLAGLEHFRFDMEHFKHFYVSSAIRFIRDRVDLYEKCQKVGLDRLVAADLSSYSPYIIKYDRTQTSLTKMLGLNKNTLRLFKNCQNRTALEWLRNHPNATDVMFDDAVCLGFSMDLENKAKALGFSFQKALSYIKKHRNDATIHGFSKDYIDYVDTLNSLGYPIDNQYLFPKNFRKADERVRKEYDEREARRRNMTPVEKIAEEARIDETIYKISKALREDKTLRQWMNGSAGLKVIVPQSVGELTDEGIKLHNCLQSYAKKIADKQTLIFFIRKLEDPSKEYVAMEYRNGQIQQIRLDFNEEVKDAQILDFANHFVEQLNKLDIINKLRRAA